MAMSDMLRLFNNGNMAGTIVSGWLDMSRIEKLSIEIQIANTTAAGTLSLEGTNQPNPSNPQQPDPAAIAVPLTGGMTPALPAVALAPGAISYMGGFTVFGQGQCRWIRLRYAFTSGTGQLNAFAHRSGPT